MLEKIWILRALVHSENLETCKLGVDAYKQLEEECIKNKHEMAVNVTRCVYWAEG